MINQQNLNITVFNTDGVKLNLYSDRPSSKGQQSREGTNNLL